MVCLKLFIAVQNCLKLFKAGQSNSKLFTAVHNCSKLAKAVQSSSKQFKANQCCSKLVKTEPWQCHNMFRTGTHTHTACLLTPISPGTHTLGAACWAAHCCCPSRATASGIPAWKLHGSCKLKTWASWNCAIACVSNKLRANDHHYLHAI